MVKGKILIVDDEKAFLESHQEEFNDAGYDVVTAENGDQAVEAMKKEKFDIAFVDLIMPGMEGEEVCRELKKISPKTEILIISGKYQESVKTMHRLQAAGAREDILLKPLAENTMVVIAEKIMDEHQKRKWEKAG